MIPSSKEEICSNTSGRMNSFSGLTPPQLIYSSKSENNEIDSTSQSTNLFGPFGFVIAAKFCIRLEISSGSIFIDVVAEVVVMFISK